MKGENKEDLNKDKFKGLELYDIDDPRLNKKLFIPKKSTSFLKTLFQDYIGKIVFKLRLFLFLFFLTLIGYNIWNMAFNLKASNRDM